MKNYQKILLAGVIIVVALIFSNCSKQTQSDQSGALESKKEVARVGVIIPLSGPLAKYGQVYADTLRLYEEENNQSDEYRKKLEFALEDNQGDAQTTVNIVNKMKNIDGIRIFFVPFSGPSMALEQMAKDGEILLMADNYSTGFAQKSPNIFNSGQTKDLEGAYLELFQYLEEKENCENVYAVSQQATIGENIKKITEEYYDTKQKKAEAELVPLTENDFKTTVLKIKERGSDCVFPFLYEYQVLTFLKQAKELELEASYGFSGVINFEEFSRSLGTYPEKGYSLMADGYPKENQSSETKSLLQKTIDEGNTAYFNYVIEAYDGITAIQIAAESCGDADVKCFSEKISNIREFAGGTSAQTKIDQDGDFVNRKFTILEIRNGKMVQKK